MLPLLSEPFIEWVKSKDLTTYEFFEFGSGYSTIFFSNLVKTVHTFEHNHLWIMKLKRYDLPNVIFSKVDIDEIPLINTIPSKSFCLIDCGYNRLQLTKKIIHLDFDFIVLDNSDLYPNTLKFIESYGYYHIPFVGNRTNDDKIEVSSTSLFIKNLDKLPKPNTNYTKPISNIWDT